ncbi:hypothetical protein F5Y17DRAFT_460378 [Xylariaceae sp. FL0594]|nr:hypothetical protein F5Y17DRAFT_460378 [Xylariaceae sp. FL0594]
MSNKIIDDVKTGLKGIRGAGDALRGEVLAATDQAFENRNNDTQTRSSELKNEAIRDKGKADMQAVDDRLAAREREREEEKVRREAGVPEMHAGHHPRPLQ